MDDTCHQRPPKRPRSESSPSNSTEIILRSDEHAQALLNRLNRQRENETLCDIRLRVEDKEFSAHRSVLAASSDFLHALLVGGWRESSENVIRLDGVDANSFRALLSFIYTGELHAQDIDELFQLLVSAEHLGIASARPICVERLQERLDLPNALRMRLLAQQVLFLAESTQLHHDYRKFVLDYAHYDRTDWMRGTGSSGI
jgi:hypothetical protein